MRRAFLPGLKLAAELVAACVAILAVLLSALAILLARGPLDLDGVAPQIGRALGRLLPGTEIAFTGASLVWDRVDPALRLILEEVSVGGAGSAELVRFPKVEIDISPAGLGRGLIAPATIRVSGAEARLERGAAGEVSLGLASRAAGADGGFATMLRRVLADRSRSSVLGYFRHLEIVDASFELRDAVSGFAFLAPQARIELARDPHETRLALDLKLSLGDALWPIAVTGRYDPETDRGRLDIAFETVAARELARLGPRLDALADWPGELRGELALDFAELDRLESAHAALIAGGIRKRFGSPFHKPLAIDTAALAARYEAGSSRLVIEALSYQSADNDGRWTGEIDLAFESEALAGATWALEGRDVRLWVPVLSDRQAHLDRLTTRGRIDFRERFLELGDVTADFGEARIALGGRYDWSQHAEAGLELHGEATSFPVGELTAFWPRGRAMGARDWLGRNLTDGIIPKAQLTLALTPEMLTAPALPNEAMRLDFTFEDATITYIAGLTPLTEAHGSAVLLGNRFDLDLDGGRVGAVTVTGGTMSTEHFEVRSSPGVFHAEARGPARDLVRLLDMGPFGYPSRYGFDVEEVTGLGEVVLDASVPLRRHVTFDEVDFAGRGKLRGWRLDEPVPGATLSDVDLDLVVDRHHFEATGTGRFNDVPVALSWRERFSGGPMSSLYRVDAVLDAAERMALGFDTAEVLEGPVSLALEARGKGTAIREAELKADLSAARIALGPGIWQKPADEPAGGRIRMSFVRPGEYRLDEVFFASAGVSLQGSATLAADGRLLAADFSEARFGSFADLSLTAKRADTGALEVGLAGRRFDASPLLEDWGRRFGVEPKEADRPAGLPVHVSGQVDVLGLRRGVTVSGVTFDLQNDGRELAAFTLTGRIGEGEIAAALAPTPGGRTFRLSAENGGEMLLGLTGMSGLEGGLLEAEARILSADVAPDHVPSANGVIRMSEFRVRNLPLLARVLMLGSFEGIGDLVQGEGIRFRRLEVPVRVTPDRVTITNAHASGQTLGLTLQGTIDRSDDVAALRGTIVPAYAVNSVVGAVPLLGDLLVGRENEGIFGVTYAIAGPVSDPRIVVNPLSALAPGLLRRLFEGGDASEPSDPFMQPGGTASSGAPLEPAP